MDAPILKYRKFPFGTIEVWKNRIVLVSVFVFQSKSIYFKQIAQIQVNKLSQGIQIETTGGEIIKFTVAGPAQEVKDTIEKYM